MTHMRTTVPTWRGKLETGRALSVRSRSLMHGERRNEASIIRLGPPCWGTAHSLGHDHARATKDELATVALINTAISQIPPGHASGIWTARLGCIALASINTGLKIETQSVPTVLYGYSSSQTFWLAVACRNYLLILTSMATVLKVWILKCLRGKCGRRNASVLECSCPALLLVSYKGGCVSRSDWEAI